MAAQIFFTVHGFCGWKGWVDFQFSKTLVSHDVNHRVDKISSFRIQYLIVSVAKQNLTNYCI